MAGKKVQQDQDPEQNEDIDELLEKITSYMGMIRRRLLGEDFSSLPVKMYNIETFDPEPCPECGQLRNKFFMLLQPGDDLFDTTALDKTVTNFKIFCLDCTKKVNVIPRKEPGEDLS
jgi:hypothetical protein